MKKKDYRLNFLGRQFVHSLFNKILGKELCAKGYINVYCWE